MQVQPHSFHFAYGDSLCDTALQAIKANKAAVVTGHIAGEQFALEASCAARIFPALFHECALQSQRHRCNSQKISPQIASCCKAVGCYQQTSSSPLRGMLPQRPFPLPAFYIREQRFTHVDTSGCSSTISVTSFSPSMANPSTLRRRSCTKAQCFPACRI